MLGSKLGSPYSRKLSIRVFIGFRVPGFRVQGSRFRS